MSKFVACRAAAVAAATVLLLSFTPPAAADNATDEAHVVALIQQARASAGAPALPLHPALSAAAHSWAATMAAAGTVWHNVGIGSAVTASKLAENIGMGPSVDLVHQGFLASPGHLANMVDTGVNVMGVGVASANGYVYVVQDFAKVQTLPPNQTPDVPTDVTPTHATVVPVSPTQVSARYTDADGTPGRVHFLLVDDLGHTAREGDSAVVCSTCVAGLSIAGLADGLYTTYAYAFDGVAASFWSAARTFAVDQTAPLPPAALARVGNKATATYSDPNGTPGWVYVYLVGPDGSLVAHGFTDRVCSGCTASFPLPAMAPGTHTLYAVAYDGLVSPTYAGPVTFTA